jgi:DNA (cytosine-5)-methyltransferase 1
VREHGRQQGAQVLRRRQPIITLDGAISPWQAFDLIACTDGKARRIEPGTFPLAHGVSGRVGLLRGYGNAIVPWLAAQFVAASFEAIRARLKS